MFSTPRHTATICMLFSLLAASTSPALGQDDGGGRIEISSSGIRSFTPEGTSGEAVDLPAYMDSIGPDAVEWYQHVQTLANPWFEGRQPGTRGGRMSAEYVAFHLDRAGCQPAFIVVAGDGTTGLREWGDDPARTWYQPFEFTPGRTARKVEVGEMAIGDRSLTDEDFRVLGNSGSETITAPITFVGYAIEDGPDGYNSFDDASDLEGRIAMILRYEPLNEDGESQWNDTDSFSEHSGISQKFQSVLDRGAVGIILVNPPGAKFGRRGLDSFRRSRNFRPLLDIPAVQLTQDEADALLQAADEKGRDLETFRSLADKGSITTIDLKEDMPVQLETVVTTNALEAVNIAGVLPGQGELADEWLIIGGHHDHLGHGYLGSRDPNSTEIHYGADDNASGIGALLVLADRLADDDDGTGDRRSILLVAFDAEEAGLHGSNWFLDHCPLEHESVTAMLNMDMMGRLRENTVSVSGTGTAEEFDEMLPRLVEPTGLVISAYPGGTGPSDHTNFYNRDIPVLFFYTGDHDDYHTPRDHAWLVNPEGTARIIGLARSIANEMVARDEMLTFSKSTEGGRGRRTGASVRLGIMPSYTANIDTGVLVDGVSDGTSAADAGIQRGDVILQWDDKELTDGSILMEALMSHKPGDKITLRILRGEETIDVEVTLKGREGA